MTEICMRYRAILRTSDNTESDALVFRARCKQWDCEHCAKINARVWQARIGLEIEKQGANIHWFFITFTLDGYFHDEKGKISPEVWKRQVSNSLQVWRNTWNKLMMRLKYTYGKFSYVRVFETHKDGTLHVHVLCNAKIAAAVLTRRKDGSTYWHSASIEKHLVDLGLGYIHDCKPMKALITRQIIALILALSQGYKQMALSYAMRILSPIYEFRQRIKAIASYLAKYMTKDAQTDVRTALRIAGMGRIRIIQSSQKWSNLPTDMSDRTWIPDALTFDDAMAIWQAGNKIIDINRKMIIDDGEHFSDTQKYPNKDSETAYQLGQ